MTSDWKTSNRLFFEAPLPGESECKSNKRKVQKSLMLVVDFGLEITLGIGVEAHMGLPLPVPCNPNVTASIGCFTSRFRSPRASQ